MLILSLVGNARVQLRGASISVVAAGSHWRLLGGIGGKSEWLYEMLLWIACRDPGEGSEDKRKLQEIKLYQLRSRMSRRSKFCLRRAFRQEYHSQITIHGSLTWIRTSWSWTTSERPTDGVGYFGDICSWTPPIWLQVRILLPRHQHECLLERTEKGAVQSERRTSRWVTDPPWKKSFSGGRSEVFIACEFEVCIHRILSQ